MTCVLEQRRHASLIYYLTNYDAYTCLTRHPYIISAPQVRFLGMLSLAPFSVFPGWNHHVSQAELFSEGSDRIPTTYFIQIFIYLLIYKIQLLVVVAQRIQLCCWLLPWIIQLARATHFLWQESPSILKGVGGSGTFCMLPVSDFLFCYQLEKKKNFTACKGLIWLDQAYSEACSLLRPALPHDLS